MVIATLIGLALAAQSPCREAYDALRYADAVERCRAAIPAAPRDALPELYRLMGLAAAAADDDATARRAFSSLLLLDPAASLSTSYAPRIRALFDDARAAARELVRFQLRAAPIDEGSALPIELDVLDGAAAPIAAVTLDGGAPIARTTGPIIALLPAPDRAGPRAVALVALDRFGGRVLERNLDVEVHFTAARPAILSPWLWGGAAVALSGAGAVLGGVARASHDSAVRAPFADDAARAQDRAADEALAATVCFAAAGALALGGLVLWLTE